MTGEVDESQIIEAHGYRGVVLNEWASTGISWQLLMDDRVVTEQTSMCPK